MSFMMHFRLGAYLLINFFHINLEIVLVAVDRVYIYLLIRYLFYHYSLFHQLRHF